MVLMHSCWQPPLSFEHSSLSTKHTTSSGEHTAPSRPCYKRSTEPEARISYSTVTLPSKALSRCLRFSHSLLSLQPCTVAQRVCLIFLGNGHLFLREKNKQASTQEVWDSSAFTPSSGLAGKSFINIKFYFSKQWQCSLWIIQIIPALCKFHNLMVVSWKKHIDQKRLQLLHIKLQEEEDCTKVFLISWAFFPSRVTACFTFNESGHYRRSQKEKHFTERKKKRNWH